MDMEELIKLLNFKLEDEHSMIKHKEHAEYYKGRQDAFQYVLEILQETDSE